MANGEDRESLYPDPGGPYIALPSVEDTEQMRRAMRGATTGRATGMARQTSDRELARSAKRTSRPTRR